MTPAPSFIEFLTKVYQRVKRANQSAHRCILSDRHSIVLVEFECLKWGKHSPFLQTSHFYPTSHFTYLFPHLPTACRLCNFPYEFTRICQERYRGGTYGSTADPHQGSAKCQELVVHSASSNKENVVYGFGDSQLTLYHHLLTPTDAQPYTLLQRSTCICKLQHLGLAACEQHLYIMNINT